MVATPTRPELTDAATLRELAASNSILSEIDPKALNAVLDSAQLVRIDHGEEFREDFTSKNVLFPVSGIIGGMLETADGASIQPVFVDSSGVIGGIRAVLGMELHLLYKVRLSGQGILIRSATTREIATKYPDLHSAISKAGARQFRLAVLNGLCGRFHLLGKRCCTWLAVVHDQVSGDVVPITHEELSEIVGATRPAVSVILSDLARKGYISSVKRGAVRIDSVSAIHNHACECWSAINADTDIGFDEDESKNY